MRFLSRGVFVLTLGVLPGSAFAQHSHGTGSHPEQSGVSAKALQQIAAVAQAAAPLGAPEALRTAGFRPVFGMIPTMGTHWVNLSRMLDTVSFLAPAQLMLSQVGGEQRLVGVAYAFLGQEAEAPDLFDGDQDAWHAHSELAPPGQSVVMLHVWFVPSPDGVFAGHNSWLPYWAAGVEPPADSVLSDSTSALRARQLALALGEAIEPLNLAQPQGDKSAMAMAIRQVRGDAPAPGADSALSPAIQARRDSLRAAIPRLNAARRAGDQASWNREADAAIAVWKEVRDAYINVLPEGRREGLAAFYKEMEQGGHKH